MDLKKSNKMIKFSGDRTKIIFFLIIFLAILIRIWYPFQQDHIIGPHDTFAPAMGALKILAGEGYNYYYLSSPGVSILLLPFAIFFGGLLAIKIAVITYSILMILLTYFFVKKIYPKDPLPPLIASLLIAINPVLITYSIVLFYDNLQIFSLLAFILITKNFQEGNSWFRGGIYCIAGMLFFLLKESNIVFILLSGIFFFLISYKKIKIKKKNFSIPKEVILFCLLFLIIVLFYFGNPETSSRATKDIPTFFLNTNVYFDNFKTTINYLSNSLNTPNFAGIFRYTQIEKSPFDFLIGTISSILLIIGSIFIWRNNKREFYIIYSIILANISFFTLFLKWQLRYYFPSLIMILILISFGIFYLISNLHNKKYLYGLILLIVFSGLIFSAKEVIESQQIYDLEEGRISNYVLLNNEDPLIALKKIENYSNAKIYTSYGPWIEYSEYLNKEQEVEIIDVYKIVYYSQDMNSSKSKILSQIERDMENGKKVFYLAGWQEFFKNNKDLSRNYNPIWEEISKEYSLTKIYSSEDNVCPTMLDSKCFELNLISKK
jgi:hypothetical protein